MIELVVSSVPPVELKVTVDAIETPTLGPALELERSHVGLSLISMMQQLAGSSLLFIRCTMPQLCSKISTIFAAYYELSVLSARKSVFQTNFSFPSMINA